jgi:sugar phosphate isomerase/epimerase
MTGGLGVAHLTALDLAPPDFIEAAAVAGFDGVGLRLLAVTDSTPGYPLMDDPALLRATRAAGLATGLAVTDIEFVKITPVLDPATLGGLLDAGAELGARHLITAPYDPDLARLADRLAAIAEQADARGIDTVLEFFPWTNVPDLDTALRVVEAAGPKIGVLVDSLHFDRSGSRLEVLSAVPAARLPFVHLCDAFRQDRYSEDDLLKTARAERLPPGEGQIDLQGFLGALPKDVWITAEVPMAALAAREGSKTVLQRVQSACRVLMAHGYGRTP